jgi:multidrug efflux system membrane fusion protein
VKTGVVETRANLQETRYSGSVSAERQVDLAFRVSGYVRSLLQVRGREVQEGDPVAQGVALASIQTTDYQARVDASRSQQLDAEAGRNTAQAQVSEARVALDQAESDFQRAENLYRAQSLTRPEYDAAKAKRDAAADRLKAAQAQIGSFDAKIQGAAAQTTEARSLLQDTVLRAPFAGVIISRKIEQGSLVSPGIPAFTLADVRSVKVTFGVPDVSLPQLRIGNRLPVTTEAIPGRQFSGRITSIPPTADPKGRVFTIELTIDNPGQVLKPGMIASVVVSPGSGTQTTVIPLSAVSALSEETGGYAVYLVEPRGNGLVARRHRVQLGEVMGNQIAVRQGLAPGQRIVVTGSSLLVDGEAIQEIPPGT